MKRERFRTPSSVFVLLRRNDQICFLHRTSTGWMDGHYSLPAGGVEPHETLSQAAAREAFEETGVKVHPEHLIHCHTLYAFTEGECWTGHFFETSIWDGEPVAMETHKHSHLKWSSLSALAEPVVPYVQEALNNLEKGRSLTEYGFSVSELTADG